MRLHGKHSMYRHQLCPIGVHLQPVIAIAHVALDGSHKEDIDVPLDSAITLVADGSGLKSFCYGLKLSLWLLMEVV